ncbi:MAG TPA: GNAT family N-acetyltransferase [Solirubrobacterales bacterium]|nr:GNAT family N-acetyltransferase [Solirubrobacterales bacterium]
MADELEIVDDQEQSRYEAHLDGETAAIADYVKQPGIVSFTHTETFPGHKGQGLAGRMIDRALRDAREEGREVLPFCSYVAHYVDGHREFLDLVPAERRAEFGLPTG